MTLKGELPRRLICKIILEGVLAKGWIFFTMGLFLFGLRRPFIFEVLFLNDQ